MTVQTYLEVSSLVQVLLGKSAPDTRKSEGAAKYEGKCKVLVGKVRTLSSSSNHGISNK